MYMASGSLPSTQHPSSPLFEIVENLLWLRIYTFVSQFRGEIATFFHSATVKVIGTSLSHQVITILSIGWATSRLLCTDICRNQHNKQIHINSILTTKIRTGNSEHNHSIFFYTNIYRVGLGIPKCCIMVYYLTRAVIFPCTYTYIPIFEWKHSSYPSCKLHIFHRALKIAFF